MKEQEYKEFILNIIDKMRNDYNAGKLDLLGYYDGFHDAKQLISQYYPDINIIPNRDDLDTDYYDGFYDACVLSAQYLKYRFPYGDIPNTKEDDKEM